MALDAKIGIIEDLPEIRAAIGDLITNTDGLRLSGSFETMEAALKELPKNPPDVLLCDIGLPLMNGIEGVRIIKEKFPEMPVLMLTVYDDNERITEAICAGATGYLLKNTSTEKLIESINEALNGGAPMSPEIAFRVMNIFRKLSPPKNVDYRLSPHETRILKMLVEGHTYASAAETLGNSVNTIATHIKRIYEKLQVHSKSQAVAKALKNGLV